MSPKEQLLCFPRWRWKGWQWEQCQYAEVIKETNLKTGTAQRLSL